MLTQANGVSIVHETVYENRFEYAVALNAMGANITVHTNCLGSKSCRFSYRNHPHSAVIVGPTPLHAAQIVCPPALRPATIILIGMLAAKGTSMLRNVYSINRGYEDLANRLNLLGAKVKIFQEL